VVIRRWETGKKYIAVVTCFAGFLYCNVKALQVSIVSGDLECY